jgi:hypothetical protein
LSAGSYGPERRGFNACKSYSEKVEVDPASPAIREFASLRKAMNELRKAKSYSSIVVLVAESDENRTS